jgi:hypothetical protein
VRHIALAAAAVLLTATGCTACGPFGPRCNLGADSSGISRCPLIAADLESHEESRLAYSGAELRGRSEQNETSGLDGISNAFVLSTWHAAAGKDQVMAWYTSALTSRHWTVGVHGPTTYSFGRSPRELISINFDSATARASDFTYDYEITSGGWRG